MTGESERSTADRTSPDTSRAEALRLANDTLRAFELSEMSAVNITRRAYRVARLLDDNEGEAWLHFEVVGYPPGKLDPAAWQAATRSNRLIITDEGDSRAMTQSVGGLTAQIQASMAQLSAATDAAVSVTSANPNQFVFPPSGNTVERSNIRNSVAADQGLLEKVMGSVFEYVSSRYQELRFGFAVETAFEIVRARVDALIGLLVPDAQRTLAAAFENATSINPEHWAAAAAACRRLLVATADELRPPGPAVGGRKMGQEQYVNRLVDWVGSQELSGTLAAFVTSDLEYLGRRLDAAADAGNKGAHSDVTRFDASRFLTGTYLILGDLLSMAPQGSTFQVARASPGSMADGIGQAAEEETDS